MVEKFLQSAINLAWKYQGLTFPNPPVGAAIVSRDERLVSFGVHKEAGLVHAELDAVANALGIKDKSNPNKLHDTIIKNYKNHFKNYTIYVTLEPCNHYGKTPACSLLLKEMGFKKVVISSLDKNKTASGGADFLKEFCEVEIGVLKEEGDKLVALFNRWITKRPFVFFKVAVSKNSVYTGGVISSKTSRQLVHRLREKTDLLVIGGESVRVDRPTLDTRLSSGKNPPDILILSHKKDFDKSIPLFSVKNRKVIISSDFDSVVKDYEFVMIEGGENLYKSLKNKIDAVMIFRSNEVKDGKSFEFGKEFKRLKKFNYFDDTIEWKINEGR